MERPGGVLQAEGRARSAARKTDVRGGLKHYEMTFMALLATGEDKMHKHNKRDPKTLAWGKEGYQGGWWKSLS